MKLTRVQEQTLSRWVIGCVAAICVVWIFIAAAYWVAE